MKTKTEDLKVTKNSDGSFTFEWNKQDPSWNFLNHLTSDEIKNIIQKEIQNRSMDD